MSRPFLKRDLPTLVRMNDVEAVRAILFEDPSLINEFKYLIPSAISSNGDRSRRMVDTLLFFGADPNHLISVISIINDASPVEIIQSLIIAGADVNYNDNDSSALINAVDLNSDYTADIVQALIIGGAEVNLQDKNGTTAMMALLNNYRNYNIGTELGSHQFLTVFNMLLAAGSDLDSIENDDGETAMNYIGRLPPRLREMVLQRI